MLVSAALHIRSINKHVLLINDCRGVMLVSAGLLLSRCVQMKDPDISLSLTLPLLLGCQLPMPLPTEAD